MNEIPLSEVSDDTLSSISEEIFIYSSPILKISFDPPGVDNVEVVGSGTFVKIDNAYGLITAHHVASELMGDCLLGLAILRDEDDFKIPKQSFEVIEIGIPTGGDYGPDLALIRLADSYCANISTSKEFYPLSDYREELLNHPPTFDIGLWAACGTPQERITLEDSEGRFSAVISTQLYCGFGGAERERVIEEYDYYKMDAEYTQHNDLPLSFKGMSGGGLWQVPITITEDRQIIPNRYLLSGIIFWQSPKDNNKRIIRCHGRESIYKQAWDSILKKCA